MIILTVQNNGLIPKATANQRSTVSHDYEEGLSLYVDNMQQECEENSLVNTWTLQRLPSLIFQSTACSVFQKDHICIHILIYGCIARASIVIRSEHGFKRLLKIIPSNRTPHYVLHLFPDQVKYLHSTWSWWNEKNVPCRLLNYMYYHAIRDDFLCTSIPKAAKQSHDKQSVQSNEK